MNEQGRRSAVRDLVLAARTKHMLRTGRAAEIRRAAGVSQRDIAEVLGVTPQSVCHWENGRWFPSRAVLSQYGALLLELEQVTTDAS